MAQNSFVASLTETHTSLRVDQFVADAANTPGNVAVCLSGGGSRAMSAGLGQLRALANMQLGGAPLLGQLKLISTVSGGSWLGVAWEYLDEGTSDEAFLNGFVADPGRLVPSATPGHSPAETLDHLPAGNIGNSITRGFSILDLAAKALILRFRGTPADFLWQALIAAHILEPYGLSVPDDKHLPTTYFSYDIDTLDSILGENPSLRREDARLIAGGSDRIRRPFVACNTAMFVREPDSSLEMLAPVQGTPFFSGIVGAPIGTDANGRAPGGGGVTSFAFSSNPTAVSGDRVTVDQVRRFSLADVVGSSSAAFAEKLVNGLEAMADDPSLFFETLDALRSAGDPFVDLLEAEAGDESTVLQPDLPPSPDDHHAVRTAASFLGLSGIVPQYQYWPVADVHPFPATAPTHFADGGNVENTGVAAALAYDDIDNIIAFVNTSAPLSAATHDVLPPGAGPDPRLVVDSQIPVLFGYQPYQPDVGYTPYERDSDPLAPVMSHNLVFPPSELRELLNGLRLSAGSRLSEEPVIYCQQLTTEKNEWWGVRGGRSVSVLWVYLNPVRSWYQLLSEDVKQILGPFDTPGTFAHFPNYPTLKTQLTATEINLLANQTAWCLADRSADVLQMFEES